MAKTLLKAFLLTTFFSFAALNTLNVRAANSPGDPDPEFQGGGVAWWFAEQPDGRILAGPSFRRLDSGGGADTAFGGQVDGDVITALVQADGKIVIGGNFSSASGSPRKGVARLNLDGTLDGDFDPNLTNSSIGNHVSIYNTAQQADGKLLIRGQFTEVAGVKRPGFARLNTDGSLDPTFWPTDYPSGDILAVQKDGKILTDKARFNTNGNVDPTYLQTSVDKYIDCLSIQADGKIILSGPFTKINGIIRNRIARLNPDGTLDTTFDPSANGRVYSVSIQTDGKIVIVGEFDQVGGVARTGCARLNPDGGLDATLNPLLQNGPFGDPVEVIGTCVQGDGRILISGLFDAMNRTSHDGMARLLNDTATQSLSVSSPGRIVWRREGASPETQTVLFDLSTDHGTSWTSLGEGTRIPGGWELTGLTLPGSGYLRARAPVSNGRTSGLVEKIIGLQSNTAPRVIAPIADITVKADAPNPVINLTSAFIDDETPASDLRYSVTQNSNPTLINPTLLAPSSLTLAFYGVGSATLTVRATDPDGAFAEATFIVTINPIDPVNHRPFVNFPIPDQRGFLGKFFSYQILEGTVDANDSGQLLTYTVQGLPAGIDFEKTTRTFKGTPSVAGNFTIRLIATDNGTPPLSATIPFDLSIRDANGLPGDLETGWGLQVGFEDGSEGSISSAVFQPDGKLVIGGNFSIVSSQHRRGICRLNTDGSLDENFAPNIDGYVNSIVLQPDGKLVVTGHLDIGTEVKQVVRLNADGTLDAIFNIDVDNTYYSVSTAAIQADGKILIGGWFLRINDQPRTGLARFSADGTLDPNFNAGLDGFYRPTVFHITVQGDGKIIIGGTFKTVAGVKRENFARLNPDGTLDDGFSPGVGGDISAVALAPDGKLILVGSFDTILGVAHKNVARINSNGTLDNNFNPIVDATVNCAALQADGKIIIGGDLYAVNGVTRNGLARLNSDGTLDSTFKAPVFFDSAAIAPLQPDGRIIVEKRDEIAGTTRVERLLNDPATQSLTVSDSGRIEWLRGGASPEVQNVVFDLSTDSGLTWTQLGVGTSIPGGWELTSLTLPAKGQIRGRARVTDGGGSSGLIETIIGLRSNTTPTVLAPIADITVNENVPDTVINLVSAFTDAETASSDLHYSVIQNSNAELLDATIASLTNLSLAFSANHFGSATVTVRATDPDGAFAEDTFAVTVNPVNHPPIVRMSIPDQKTELGVPFSYQLPSDAIVDEDQGQLLTYSAAGLPAGIDFDVTARAFNGTPGATGNFIVQIIATDNGTPPLSATNTFALLVTQTANHSPVISSSIPNQSTFVGVTYHYTFPSETFVDPDAGQTLSYSASGLPPGVNFNPTTRSFEGIPANPGSFTIHITAVDSGSPPLAATSTFILQVTALPRIDGVKINAAGEFQFEWTDTDEGKFHVEASDDLINWRDAGAGSSKAGIFEFHDAPASQNSHQYYRLKSL